MSISFVKDLGAVFTPRHVVGEMLGLVPECKTTRCNRWLEPCAGDGAFVSEIKARYPLVHLTCVEIEPQFAKRCLERTGVQPIVSDFLDLKFETCFDVIVGNPPYQKPNKNNGRARGGRCQLYMEFMTKCLSLLAPAGVLVFIHPSGWRKIGSAVLPKILRDKHVRHLTLHKKKVFPRIGVSVDWYAIENTPNGGRLTEIRHADGETHMVRLPENLPFIPNEISEDIISDIFSIHDGRRYARRITCELHAYTKKHLLSKTKSEKHVYPVYHTSAQPWLWSEKPHSFQHSKKVIMSNSGKLSPFYDDGVLGTSQNAMFIVVGSREEGERIVAMLESDRYSNMIAICQWGLFRTERKLIEYLAF